LKVSSSRVQYDDTADSTQKSLLILTKTTTYRVTESNRKQFVNMFSGFFGGGSSAPQAAPQAPAQPHTFDPAQLPPGIVMGPDGQGGMPQQMMIDPSTGQPMQGFPHQMMIDPATGQPVQHPGMPQFDPAGAHPMMGGGMQALTPPWDMLYEQYLSKYGMPVIPPNTMCPIANGSHLPPAILVQPPHESGVEMVGEDELKKELDGLMTSEDAEKLIILPAVWMPAKIETTIVRMPEMKVDETAEYAQVPYGMEMPADTQERAMPQAAQ